MSQQQIDVIAHVESLGDGQGDAPEWVIEDESMADWALDRIRRAEESLARIQQNAEAAVRRAKTEAARTRSFFEPKIRDWAERHRPARGKTIHLMSGDLAWRKKPAKLEVTDKHLLLAWSRDHLPDAIKTEESLLKTPVSDYFKRTGEQPPGTLFVPEHEQFEVG